MLDLILVPQRLSKPVNLLTGFLCVLFNKLQSSNKSIANCSLIKLYCSKLNVELVMAEKQKFLGEFEQMIMLTLLLLDEQAYGASIRSTLAQEVGREVAIGAIYSTLERLERKAMVTSKLGESTAQRGGRPKRFFKVTAQGQQALKKARAAMDTLWQGISIRQLGYQEMNYAK